MRALGSMARGTSGIVQDLFGTAYDLLLLAGLPVLYLAASYLVLDIPARWMAGREPLSLWSAGELLIALVVSLIGVARVLQEAPPVAPVRPRFARALLLASWIAGLVFTIGDLRS